MVEIDAIPEPAPDFLGGLRGRTGRFRLDPDPGSRGTPGLVTRQARQAPEVALSDTPWPIDQSVFAAPGATVLSAQVAEPTEPAPAPAEEAPTPAARKAPAKKAAPAQARAGQEGGEESSGVRSQGRGRVST